MKKFLRLCLILVLAVGVTDLWAQDRTVSGKVTSLDDGSSLPGVNVVLKGSTSGTVTDIDGNYSLSVPNAESILVYSFIGLETQEIQVGSRSVIDIQMAPDALEIAEVVVTALGIEKDRRALQYSTQSLDSDELLKAPDPNNAINSLSGKVAGVQVVNTGGSIGAPTVVIIRGMSSINDNQPLYVVDGIPIDNQQLRSGQNVRDGVNYGNAATDLNANDIESMTVLKGPAAAALYGSRANNGVILVTTKRAAEGQKGLGVSFNSNVTFDQALKLPDFQTTYGEGINGSHTIIDESWGPRIGTPGAMGVTDWKGDVVDLKSYPDNLKDFLETGKTVSNSLAISGRGENTDFRLSYTKKDQSGILPNTEMSQNTVAINAGVTADKLTVRLGASYINTESENLGAQGQGNNSIPVQWLWAPRSLDWSELRNYRDFEGTQGDADGTMQRKWINYFDNPYFLLYENTYTQTRNRVIGNIGLDYALTDWLRVNYKIGLDTYSDNREQINQVGTGSLLQGGVSFQEYTVSQLNHEVQANVARTFGDVNLNFLAGFNANERQSKNLFASGTGLIAPDLFNLGNMEEFATPPTNNLTKRRLVGLYGSLDMDYKNTFFLSLTARNDWSSTLPEDNNSFFYPSVGVGFAFTELLDIDDRILSFGKIRASWAQVGKDADPYLLQSVYVQPAEGNFPAQNTTFPFRGVAAFTVGNNIGNQQLSPEITTSYEVGADLSFLQSRINLDVTYYDANTEDQIINVAVPISTGYASQTINAGKVNNKGWEILLSGDVLRVGDFVWNTALNFTRNRSEVLELFDGLDDLAVGGPQSLRVGEPYGVIYDRGDAYTDDGQRIINPNTGLPQRASESTVLGDPNPDFLLGIQNELSYKGISLSVLVDMRQGGVFRSFSYATWKYTGQLQSTTVGREGGVVLDGVIDNGDGTFRENDVAITAQDLAKGTSIFNTRYSLLGASYAKLREVRLGYSFPETLINRLPFNSINVAVVGRNLLLWNTEQDYIDPEVTTRGLSNAVGTEYASLPSTRSLGFNLRLTF